MKIRRLIAIPGFVLVAFGFYIVYLGLRISHYMASASTASGGFFIVVIGMFLILLSGIFDSVLKKRWGY